MPLMGGSRERQKSYKADIQRSLKGIVRGYTEKVSAGLKTFTSGAQMGLSKN